MSLLSLKSKKPKPKSSPESSSELYSVFILLLFNEFVLLVEKLLRKHSIFHANNLSFFVNVGSSHSPHDKNFLYVSIGIL